MFRFLMVLTIASAIGLQTWRTLFNNFAVEIVQLEGNHIGMIQSIREIPGFLALLAVYILLVVKEHRLSAISVVVLGLGVAATGFFPSYIGLILTTMLMSFGFHYYETTNQSLTLQYFDKRTSPWVIGKMRSISAASNLVVGAVILVLSPLLSYLNIYVILGSCIILAGFWGFQQEPTKSGMVPQRKEMVFRKQYWLYYFLTFMAGNRRQVFVAFAVFLLVKKFDFTIQEITLLFMFNNVINFFLNPLIGKAIIRFGERWILSLEYFSLIFIFIAYAYTDSKLVVAVLYVLDHIFFNFSMAIKTYFQKIGDPADIAPSMAVGFTINHLAAVVIPAIGGILWMVDYRIPFLAGAVMSVISLLAAQCIKTEDIPVIEIVTP